MKKINFTLLLISIYMMSANAWAVKVNECEDELGNKTFQKVCPPGSSSVGEKNYSTNSSSSSASRSNLSPLVLYLVPDCDVCNEVKEFLAVRNISLTEKNVKDDVALQQELKSKTGGDLRVPVLVIGEKTVSGYNRSGLTSALTEAGYISEEAEGSE